MTPEQVFWLFWIGFSFGMVSGAAGAWLLAVVRLRKVTP